MARSSLRLLPPTVLVLALGLAAPAVHAASLQLATDKVTYFPHIDIIELTITADSQGDADPNGAVSLLIEHDPNLVTPLGAAGPADLFTRAGGSQLYLRGDDEGDCGWEPGRENQCVAFQQSLPMPAPDTDPGARVATLLYSTKGGGIATFTFRDVAGDDFVFFDLGDASDTGTGSLYTHAVWIAPEPGTAALLGLGLVGLAARRRVAAR